MPANVESMFSVRQMPWHREGTVLPDYPGDWNTARKLAGLDWDLADGHARGGMRTGACASRRGQRRKLE